MTIPHLLTSRYLTTPHPPPTEQMKQEMHRSCEDHEHSMARFLQLKRNSEESITQVRACSSGYHRHGHAIGSIYLSLSPPCRKPVPPSTVIIQYRCHLQEATGLPYLHSSDCEVLLSVYGVLALIGQ